MSVANELSAFPPFFSPPKGSPSPGGSVPAAWPRAVRSCCSRLGGCSGLWPPGTTAASGEEMLLHWPEWWPEGRVLNEGCQHLVLAGVAAQGWLAALYSPQVIHPLGFPLGGRAGYSAGMILGASGGFSSPRIL